MVDKSKTHMIVNAATAGSDIAEIAERMKVILDEIPMAHAITTCLYLAVAFQAPDLTAEEIIEIVMDLSKFICTSLAGTDVPDIDINMEDMLGTIDKKKLN